MNKKWHISSVDQSKLAIENKPTILPIDIKIAIIFHS